MFSVLRSPEPQIIEKRADGLFEPAHADFYAGKPGRPLSLILQARRDLLSIWRRKDYTERVTVTSVLGRKIIVVNRPEAIKYVMVTRRDNFERKSPQMRRALESLLGDGLFISDGETWRTRRSLVADIVHKNRVPGFGPAIEQTAQEMAERWSKRADGESFDMLTEMATLTAEIIARSVFGNKLGSDAAVSVTQAFTRYQHLIDSVNFGYFLGFDEGLPVLKTPALRSAVRQLHGIIDTIVEDHIAGRGDDNSMVELLLRRQARNPELKLDLVALRNEASTIFMAGHETTAATLTWAWYLLANAPWVEQSVHDEIARVCGNRAPTVADVPKLDWCRAVIEETLRLYPPVPFLARQAAEADEIDGIAVPRASLVLVVPWLLQRTASLFPDPHTFRPERFLVGRPAPYSYIPFASGPRVCPGLQFGLTESIVSLATIAQRFRVRVARGHRVEPVCHLTLRPRGGLPVTLDPR